MRWVNSENTVNEIEDWLIKYTHTKAQKEKKKNKSS